MTQAKAPHRALLIGPLAQAAAWTRREIAAWLKAGTSYVVAVDGGLDAAARLKVKVDWAVGDWDSLSSRSRLDRVRHLTLPRAKDRSDLHYALQTVLNAECSHILCVGFLGGPRWDQHQATLAELAIAGQRAQVEAIGPDLRLQVLSKRVPYLRARLAQGDLVSVFAWSSASTVSLSGFRFPLSKGRLIPNSQGLSNEAKGGIATVRVHKGTALIMRPLGN